MSNVALFNAALPAFLQGNPAAAAINNEVSTGSQHPVLSIKGKVFTLVKAGERRPLMVEFQGQMIPSPSVDIVVLRANSNARSFYEEGYQEGSEGAGRPDCYTMDGSRPAADSAKPQCNSCAACPRAVFKMQPNGVEGTECRVMTLASIVPDDQIALAEPEPFLLRIPAGSKRNFASVVKMAKERNVPYNAIRMRVAFDPTAPAPKLVFTPIGFVDQVGFGNAQRLHDNEDVKDMIGLGPQPEAAPALPPAPAYVQAPTSQPAAAPATMGYVQTGASTAVPPAPTPQPVQAPAPQPVQASVAPDPTAQIAALQAQLQAAMALVAQAQPSSAVTQAPVPVPAPVQAAAEPVVVSNANILADLDALLAQQDDAGVAA